MLSFKLTLLFTFLLLSKGYAPSVTPCQTTVNCNIKCRDNETPICANNTCFCQRCNLFPPLDFLSSHDEDQSFVNQKCTVNPQDPSCKNMHFFNVLIYLEIYVSAIRLKDQVEGAKDVFSLGITRSI
ncbi:hypothetical protein KY290_034354 [Solanum tuberosum]|uniref:Uncharacterized protein n=1 Tax=Solanum tuberosum TaxID=4113 RepID=A0ABQ7U330_SOLTU|nr:hypothetical protein KY284_033456 [Solanum tuberosum]KAH0741311.1 hypothetical protein KY290_034354 [Solanum tuberosum]